MFKLTCLSARMWWTLELTALSLNLFSDYTSKTKMANSGSGINTGDERLIFESSEAISVVPTFDQLGLKEDLLRGIYAYSKRLVFQYTHSIHGDNHSFFQTLNVRLLFSNAP